MTETDDVVALWRLQSQYADVVTRRAWAELHDVFLPDTTVHVETVTRPAFDVIGPDAFGTFVRDAIARYDHFTFVILNTVVDVTGPDEARGRFFMCEVRHDAETDTWPNAHGVYRDRYTRVDGRWRITERWYRSLAREGPPSTVLGLPPDLGWPAQG